VCFGECGTAWLGSAGAVGAMPQLCAGRGLAKSGPWRWRQGSARMRSDRDGRGPPLPKADPVCPLCGRPIPPGSKSSLHHLVPKLKGGAKCGTVRLHQICHSAIHARFSEAEIARRLADIDRLEADPALAEFLAWVRTKPADFHAPTRLTRHRRDRRNARRPR